MTIGPVLGLDRLVRLVDVELHAVELLQQVVGELDVGLVDLVDQQHGALVQRERLPQLALADVVADVGHALVAQLAVAQAAHGVVLVEALQRLGGRLDVPLDQRRSDRLGHLERQHRLAGPGLALHQQRPLQRDGGVDGDLEIVGRNVVLGALELHDRCDCLPAGKKTRDLRETGSGQASRARRRAKKERHFQAALAVAHATPGGRTQGRAPLRMTGNRRSERDADPGERRSTSLAMAAPRSPHCLVPTLGSSEHCRTMLNTR